LSFWLKFGSLGRNLVVLAEIFCSD
jgi:hypothetical protein